MPSKKKTSKKRSRSRSRKRSPYRYNRRTKLLSEVTKKSFRRRRSRSVKRNSRRARSTPRRSIRVQVSPRKIVDISAFSTIPKRSYISRDGFQQVRRRRSIRNSARKYRLTTGGSPRSSLSSRVRRINSQRRN